VKTRPFEIAALLAGILMASASPARAQPAPTAEQLKTKAAVFLRAAGLAENSQRQYWVYRGKTCVAKPVAGRPMLLAPGKYEIRVGFFSGYRTHEVELAAGQRYEVPTGLLTLRQVTPADRPSTVPQKIYFGDTYLATGYQGDTARLLPGTYRVCHQDPAGGSATTAVGPWHVMGLFPNPQTPRKHAGYGIKYPPEDDPVPDLGKAYTHSGREFRWIAADEQYPEFMLTRVFPNWGIAYATATIESDAPREVELIVTLYGGGKVWLNGQLVKAVAVPVRAYLPQRISTFVKLNEGKNVLLVKSPRTTTLWTLGATVVDWRMYEVEVAADGSQIVADADRKE